MPTPIKLEGWPDGLNTILRPDSLPVDALRRCVNYDIDDAGKLSRRGGSTKIYSGTIVKGTLWSSDDFSRTLFVESGSLWELIEYPTGTYTPRLVRTNVGNTRMSYLDLNGNTYYTNGIQTGLMLADGNDVPWGMIGPGSQPNLTQGISGELFAGTYQVAITYIADSGEESGTGLAKTIEVAADNSSIFLSDFPASPPGTAFIRVYVSHMDGEGLYRMADLHPAAPHYEIDRVSNTAAFRLQTQFGMAPPPGDILEYHNGRIYIANNNILWFTEPLRYGLVKPMKGFLQFPKRITIVKAVDDGLYVCSDKTYWISGADTPQFHQREVLPYGGVFGTGINIPNFDAVAWFSKRGIVFGGENGEVLNIMQDRVAVAEYGYGTMLWREYKGIRQIVADLWEGELNTYAAADYVALETARGGAFI
jgi:hypothetical protein